MRVSATAKYIRRSTRKTRLVTQAIVGRPVEEAAAILQFMPQGAARDVAKVLKSAAASYVSMVTYLVPVIGVLLGVVILAERLSWTDYVGFGLILLMSRFGVGFPVLVCSSVSNRAKT